MDACLSMPLPASCIPIFSGSTVFLTPRNLQNQRSCQNPVGPLQMPILYFSISASERLVVNQIFPSQYFLVEHFFPPCTLFSSSFILKESLRQNGIKKGMRHTLFVVFLFPACVYSLYIFRLSECHSFDCSGIARAFFSGCGRA